MNTTQWMFELEAMNLEEQRRFDEIRVVSQAVRRQIIHLLGLNLMPVEDATTHLLREPEDHECLPLVTLLGREEVLAYVKEKREEYINQREVQEQLLKADPIRGSDSTEDTGVVEMTPEQLDEFMRDDGDVEFENTPQELMKAMGWGGKQNQMFLENLVLSKDDLGEDPLSSGGRTIREARKDLLKRPRRPGAPPSIQVEELDLGSSSGDPDDAQRPSVTLDVK